MNKIWDRKSEVIGRWAGKKKRMTTQNRQKSNAKKIKLVSNLCTMVFTFCFIYLIQDEVENASDRFSYLIFTGEEESLPPTPTHRSLSERYAERDAMAMEAASRAMEEATRKMEEASRAAALAAEEPPRKRLMTEEDRIMAHPGVPSAHLKITSRSEYMFFCIMNSLILSFRYVFMRSLPKHTFVLYK